MGSDHSIPAEREDVLEEELTGGGVTTRRYRPIELLSLPDDDRDPHADDDDGSESVGDAFDSRTISRDELNSIGPVIASPSQNQQGAVAAPRSTTQVPPQAAPSSTTLATGDTGSTALRPPAPCAADVVSDLAQDALSWTNMTEGPCRLQIFPSRSEVLCR